MRDRTIRDELIQNVAMLTKLEAAEALGVSPLQVDKMRQCGLLKATRTGQGWRFSQEELRDFQRDLRGVDVSNEKMMVAALSRRT